jgi:hypothetical protein
MLGVENGNTLSRRLKRTSKFKIKLVNCPIIQRNVHWSKDDIKNQVVFRHGGLMHLIRKRSLSKVRIVKMCVHDTTQPHDTLIWD